MNRSALFAFCLAFVLSSCNDGWTYSEAEPTLNEGDLIKAACPESRHVRSRVVTGNYGPEIILECRSMDKPYTWLRGTVTFSGPDWHKGNGRKIYFTDPRGCLMNTSAAINF